MSSTTVIIIFFPCPTFKSKTADESLQTVDQLNFCRNCLGANHRANNCPSNCKEQGCGQRHNTLLHGANSRYGRTLTSIVQANSQLNNSRGNGNSFAVISNKDTTTTKDTTAATKTTNLLNLLYVMPVIFHNKENKVRTYAFIDPGSSLTILLSKTAIELRLQKETCQQLVLEGANGTDTKTCYLTPTEISNLEDDERYNRKQINVMGNINMPKLREHLGDIARKYDHLRHVNMPTLDNLQVTVLIGQDNINLISPIRVEPGPSSRPSASPFKNLAGLFLDLIQYWMIAKHNIQCTILLCFAAIALNKTLTSMKKFPFGAKPRQNHWKSKANKMIQTFCLPTRYLTQHA